MALLLIAVVNIMLVERMMRESDSVADTVNIAGKLRMLGQRIALQAVGHAHGIGAGESEVRQLIGDFEVALQALSGGGQAFGLQVYRLSEVHEARVRAVHEQWSDYRLTALQLMGDVQRRGKSSEGAQLSDDANFRQLLERVAGQSAGLLQRTEALMSGILTDVQAVQNRTIRRMYVLVAVDVLLILLAFMAVRRQIVVPLRDLSTHCVELASGNYNTRFQVSTQDEIGHLAKVFNESAEHIGSLVERIEKDRHDLVRAESMFRGIAENSMVGVYIAQRGRFLYVNAKMAEMFGYTRHDMVEHVPSTIIFTAEDENDDEPGSRRRLGGEVPGLWMEKKGRRKDGTLIEVEIFGSLMVLDDELVTIGIALDITRRKEVEVQARLAMLVHRHSSEAMVVTDPVGRLISVNPAFTQITGYQSEDVIGRKLSLLSSGRHGPEFYQQMWADIHSTGTWEGDIWNRRKNGEIYAERLIINTCYDDDGAPRYRIGVFSDITKQKEASALIWRQANYDPLTGLPNRQLLHARLGQEMERSDSTHRPLALIHLDIDGFKELNDTLGRSTGDRLLMEVGERLQSCVRSTDTVARLSGDDFMVLLGGLSDLQAADRICHQMMAALTEPLVLDDARVVITASMGMTFYPTDGGSIRELVHNADLAMYAAKEQGKQRIVRFQPSMQAHMKMRRELCRDLSLALVEQQFHLVYQPIVNLQTGNIDKVECLLRWAHPEKGQVSPSVFIPFAEDTGLINGIGEWVFLQATRQVARWRKVKPELQVSINVSPVQFMDNGIVLEAWEKQLASLGMSGAEVLVEVTEKLLMGVDPDVSRKLMALRKAGVQIALDDFGAGYSSMSYLKRFDIDYIKIDQNFVGNLGRSTDDLVLCEAMIGMAHRLGLKVIAEGVETAQQRALLVKAGCDFAQGFLFSAPVQADAFELLLRAGLNAPASSSSDQANTGQFAHRT